MALQGGQGEYLHHAALTSVFQKAEQFSAAVGAVCWMDNKTGQGEESEEVF